MLDKNTAPKPLDLVRYHMRVKHYSIRAETQYVQSSKRFSMYGLMPMRLIRVGTFAC